MTVWVLVVVFIGQPSGQTSILRIPGYESYAACSDAATYMRNRKENDIAIVSATCEQRK